MKERLKELLKELIKASENKYSTQDFQAGPQWTASITKRQEQLEQEILSLLPTPVDVEKEAEVYAKSISSYEAVQEGLIKAVKYGASLTSQWIEVGDRLPEEDIYVLGAYEHGVHVAAVIRMASGKWHMYGDYGSSTVEVTHWMHLPPAPLTNQKD